jgi:hypothetical protein
MTGKYVLDHAIVAMLGEVERQRMDKNLDALIQELRDARAEASGGFSGEVYFSCEYPECPAKTYDIRVIERGSQRLKMLPKCSFCGRNLHYAGLHAQ